MYLFAALMAVAFVFGPTTYLLNLGSEAFGGYVTEFIEMSLYANVAGGTEWVGAWTVFYWAWWFSFAPMIGIFIARICRGRTIRQIVFAGLVGTSAASFPWFVAWVARPCGFRTRVGPTSWRSSRSTASRSPASRCSSN